MLIGHYSASLVAKRLRPEIPLWVLCIAAQLIDIVWGALVLLNFEHVRIVPSLPSVPLELYYMPYSHSLTGAIGWTILILVVCRFAHGWWKNAAVVIAAVVLSHWFLDLIVHRPDLPLYANLYKVGFALWDHPALGVAVESALLLAGLALLCRAAFFSRVQRLSLVVGFIALVVLNAAVSFGLMPAPTSVTFVVVGQLLLYALVAAGTWWLERNGAKQ